MFVHACLLNTAVLCILYVCMCLPLPLPVLTCIMESFFHNEGQMLQISCLPLHRVITDAIPGSTGMSTITV